MSTEGGEERLIVLCGLPGVGKTTVGELIAERTDGRLLRTDVVRKELFEQPAYTDPETDRVYAEVIDRGIATAADGQVAILDGTFRDRPLRDRVVAAAEQADVPLLFVKVTCEESTAIERIRRRTDDESDAEVEDYDHFREIFDPLDREHVTINNSDSVDQTRTAVENCF